MKRWLPHIGIVLGISIAVYALFFSDSEEDLIRARLEQLEVATKVKSSGGNLVIRAARVRKAFSEIFIKDVSFQIPELSSIGSGRNKLVALAANAPRRYQSAAIDLDGLEIKIDEPQTSAIAFGEATLSATRRGGQLERDTRTVSLRLDKIDGEWRIVSVSVSAKDAP